MKKTLVAAILLCSLLSACACAATYPMRIRDARGKEVIIQHKPVRIVSLTPDNTEILYALGLKDRIVGVNKYSDFPADAKTKPQVGDMTISSEAVVGLKPDLVLAQAFMNSSVIPKLEKLGLTVFATDPKTISEVVRNIRTVGQITSRPQTANSVASEMARAVAGVKANRARRAPRKVLVIVQSNPLWVVGPKTFVDEMIKLANATNAAFDARPGFVTFSKEQAISRNPDVIIMGQKADVDYFLKNPAWQNTAAVKNKRVLVINNDLLVRPGPRLAIGLRQLAEKVDF